MRNSVVMGILGAAALAGVASADYYIEQEPNNSLATANNVGSYTAPGDAFLVDGSVAPSNDEDWFVFSVSDATQMRIAVFGRPNSDPPADSFLELYDSGGNLLASDDDSNINLFSSIEYNAATGGTFYIKVTSYQGGTSFDYKLIVGLNIVPAPASMAVLGLATLGFRRRR